MTALCIKTSQSATEFIARLNNWVHCSNVVKAVRFHYITSSGLSSSQFSVKEEFLPLILCYQKRKLIIHCIPREECNHLVSASFLEGAVTFFSAEKLPHSWDSRPCPGSHCATRLEYG
jgi:hypothetical protein